MDWKQKLRILALLYFMEERGLEVPVFIDDGDLEFMENDITQMYAKSLINFREKSKPEPKKDKKVLSWFKKKQPTTNDPEPQFYEVTDKGRELIAKMLEAFDHSLQFNIFWQVAIAAEVPEEKINPDNEPQILDHVYDEERFPPEPIMDEAVREELGVEDLRLAMMTWFAEKTNSKLPGGFDPRVVIFIQKLADGYFDTEAFWYELQVGTFFDMIEEIVESSYKWTDFGDDDEESDSIASVIYASGMLENAKRNGDECSHCGAALAVMLNDAGVEQFESCPICNEALNWEEVEEYEEEYNECPKCASEIPHGRSSCPGCGAEVNFAMAEGTVDTHQEYEDAEPFYDYDYYGYEPYGYYYPYDPFYDALAFAVFCDVMIW